MDPDDAGRLEPDRSGEFVPVAIDTGIDWTLEELQECLPHKAWTILRDGSGYKIRSEWVYAFIGACFGGFIR